MRKGCGQPMTIGSVKLTPKEADVLRALVSLRRETTVPLISSALPYEISNASLYSLLERLYSKHHLVQRREKQVVVENTTLKRICWMPEQAAQEHFARIAA